MCENLLKGTSIILDKLQMRMDSAIQCYNRYKWRVFFSLVPFILFNFVQFGIMNVLSAYIMQVFNISAVKLGFIGSVYFYTDLIFTFFSGILLDFFSPKKLVMSAIGVSLFGLVYIIMIPNIFSLVIWRLAAGITCSFSIAGSFKIISNHFRTGERGLVIGLIGMTATAAGVFFQTPLSLILQTLGFNITLLTVFGMGVISLCLIYFFISDYLLATKVTFIQTIKSTSKIFLDFKNLCAALFECLINLPLIVLGALWGNIYLTKIYMVNNSVATVIISMLFLGHMISAPIFGFLTDRINSRRILLLSGTGMAIVSILLINLLSYHYLHIFLLLILFLMLGVSTGAQIVADAFVVEHADGMSIARAVSLLPLISVIGGIMFQPMFGLIVQHSRSLANGYQHAMLILVFTSFLAAIFSFYIPNRVTTNI